MFDQTTLQHFTNTS